VERPGRRATSRPTYCKQIRFENACNRRVTFKDTHDQHNCCHFDRPHITAYYWRTVAKYVYSCTISEIPGGNVISAGGQVTLCDPIWYVSSRSGKASSRTAISVYFTLLYFWKHVTLPVTSRSRTVSTVRLTSLAARSGGLIYVLWLHNTPTLSLCDSGTAWPNSSNAHKNRSRKPRDTFQGCNLLKLRTIFIFGVQCSSMGRVGGAEGIMST